MAIASCGGSSLSPRAPAHLDSRARALCASHIERPAKLSLAGIEPDVREAIRRRVRAGSVVVVAARARDCNLDLEVLSCTRRVVYRPAPPAGPNAREVNDPSLATDIAGGATLAAIADGRRIRLETLTVTALAPSWYLDVIAARTPLRWGPIADADAPTLERGDLFGPDCARATHTIGSVEQGAYRVDALDPRGSVARTIDATACQPPATCDETIAIELVPLHTWPCPPGAFSTTSACVRPPEVFATLPPLTPAEVARGTCPRAVAGQMTEEAAQAKRLFDAGQWVDAYLAAARVSRHEMGDDEGNEELAGWRSAVALDRLGDRQEAMALMAAIARRPCHVARDAAAFYLTAVERRAQP